ncbi:substrate-binding domain-containing protein, partial [bacterium]|nr:substrate-binding domain-containing protein [bacterium]
MPSPRRIAVMFDGDHLGPRDSQTLRGIARYADVAGWRIVLDYYAIFHPSPHWDGVIAPFRKGVRKPIERCPVPVVCVSWSRSALRAARVVENRHEAGRLAARHLVERGYRSFAYVGFTLQGQSFFERHEFAHELGRMGRGVAMARTFASYARTRRWWEKVMSALGTLVAKLTPPMGIFVARPGLARCVADLALSRGLGIPEDVGIISADDDPAVCDVAPSLTSMH